MKTPSEAETIAEIARLGKTAQGGVCLCCGQAVDAETRALGAERAIKAVAADRSPSDAILDMAKYAAEVIRNVSTLLHVQGQMPDSVYRRMIASANQIREDALRLESSRK